MVKSLAVLPQVLSSIQATIISWLLARSTVLTISRSDALLWHTDVYAGRVFIYLNK